LSAGSVLIGSSLDYWDYLQVIGLVDFDLGLTQQIMGRLAVNDWYSSKEWLYWVLFFS
jgi:hypothetical protein